MSIWEKLAGTMSGYLRLGLTGPRLKDSSGTLLVRNAGDTADAPVSSSRVDTGRATVASHATTADIWSAAGNQIEWTGTATTTIFPNAPKAGVERTLICAGACSFTASANMLIDGVASASTVTCAANDQMVVKAVSTTQFKLSRIKYDGTAQVSSGSSSNVPSSSLYFFGQL